MTPTDPMKVVAELLDLPILDKDGRYCGIVDDVEFAGGPGHETRMKALLVGPGAYAGRMPAWLMALVRLVAGDHMVRVSLDRVKSINSTVHLDCAAAELGLGRTDDRLRAVMPRWGAL